MVIPFVLLIQKNDSQMFFSSKIKTVDVAEQLRSVPSIAECGRLLRGMFLEFDFGLDKSFCDANDILNSYRHFEEKCPTQWIDFCLALADHKTVSISRERIFDTLFQIIYKMVHGNWKLENDTIISSLVSSSSQS